MDAQQRVLATRRIVEVVGQILREAPVFRDAMRTMSQQELQATKAVLTAGIQEALDRFKSPTELILP